MKAFAILLLTFCICVEAGATASQDLESIRIYREGLRNVIAFASTRSDLFPRSKLKDARVLTREQKEAVWAAWRPFLDYMLALDAMRNSHHGFLKLKGPDRQVSFLAYYASFLSQYRYAVEFVMIADRDPAIDTILNEPVPEIGLDRNSYAQLKQRFLLNPVKGGGWGTLESMYRAARIRDWPDIRMLIDQDSRFIREIAKGKGEFLAAVKAAELARKYSLEAIFPVQSGVSEWMGDTKVVRPDISLVTKEQIEQMIPKLEPGDILLERREWYISNIGLPGFWPHAALYIGTPDERRRYFEDAEVKAWLHSQGQTDGSLDSYLRLRYPDSYRKSVEAHLNHPPRVLEAISEGVSFTTLEHSAEADSVAVLRPRLSRKEKAVAIVRAFHYAGRPYDFNFDFQTDSSLVCTELIYKAYEPAGNNVGLSLPLVEIIGRMATPANEIVKQFDEQYGTVAQQMDFVLFLDGQEKARHAVDSTLAEFRQSWKRPKWHILASK